jgi:hypothetical protein
MAYLKRCFSLSRHIDRAQKTPTEIVDDKQTGSWKIKEKDEKRRAKE